MTWAIECTHITKKYGSAFALSDFSLHVEAGTVVGFLGPNGAGKTTAMRVIMGLARPTSGQARVLGSLPGEPDMLARTGALIESPALYSALSARRHLQTVAAWAGVPVARCDEVLRLVGLSKVGRKPTRTFSQGMKQRLGIATALLKDPELLVLDEPVNGLDPQGMSDMRTLIRQLQTEGRTILVSSHMLGEIDRVCDHIAVMNAGHVVAEGTVEQISALGTAHDELSALEDAFFTLTREDTAA